VDQVRRARGLLAALLDASPTADDAVLLVSEIATNAVAHSASGTPGGTFILRARADHDGCIHAEVEDQGSRWDGNIGAAEAPHGLYLLRTLSAACGTRRGEHGWVTWFTLTARRPRPRPH
jgi:anti-sigma regulatory factor (Ser/Thr protein kinase)